MSVIYTLIVSDDYPPSLSDLNQEALRTNEPIEFFYDTDLKTHRGYLPVRAYGRDTGFEFYFAQIGADSLPNDAGRYGSHEIVARTGSDLSENIAALLFLKIAARLTNGAYVYPADETVVPPNGVEAYLSQAIDTLHAYMGGPKPS